MSAFADDPKPVEGWNSERSGEVAIRTAANSGFVELPSNLAGDALGFFV